MLEFKHILLLTTLALVTIFPRYTVKYANAQTTSPFLNRPYYGTKSITSYFDHEFPNYAQNNIFTRYDGVLWTNTPVDAINCNTGINCYDGHDGIDFGNFDPLSNYYEPVLAAASGYVARAEWDNSNNRYFGYGLVIEISHSNGYRTRYGHLSSIAVEQGQFVTSGQIIGTAGKTGNADGVHLHFGVLDINNQPVDPFGWSGNYTDPWSNLPNMPALWIGGAPIPSPQYSHTSIIDNGNWRFNKGCTYGNYWWDVSGIGYWGDMAYAYIDTWGNCDAEWQPIIIKSGLYDVEVYVPGYHATSWQADFRVLDNTWHHTKVDQWGTDNKWLSLGTHYFIVSNNTQTAQTVWINDYTSETDTSRK